MDEYNRERLQSHHFAPQQCKDFYKNVEVDPKFRDCPLRTGVPMWREFETCLNREGQTMSYHPDFIGKKSDTGYLVEFINIQAEIEKKT